MELLVIAGVVAGGSDEALLVRQLAASVAKVLAEGAPGVVEETGHGGEVAKVLFSPLAGRRALSLVVLICQLPGQKGTRWSLFPTDTGS